MTKANAMAGAALVVLCAGAAPANDQAIVNRGSSTVSYTQAELEIVPAKIWYDTDHATAAVGLRNRLGGGIELSGVPICCDQAEAVILHWSYTGVGADAPPDLDKIRILRVTPPGPYSWQIIQGELVGESDVNCWEFNSTARVYRKVLTAAERAALGFDSGVNGSFAVSLMPGTTPIMGGRDPWATNGYADELAAADGVALTAVYHASCCEDEMGKTMLFDAAVDGYDGLAGKLFNTSASYVLHGLEVANQSESRFTFISFGGQTGHGGEIDGAVAGEVMKINGVDASGLASYATRFYDGASGLSSPQLMDARSVEHELTAGQSDVTIEVFGDKDCVVPGAVILTSK